MQTIQSLENSAKNVSKMFKNIHLKYDQLICYKSNQTNYNNIFTKYV